MKWVFGAAIAAIVCTGCRNPAPVYDPFMGRTTIEPPGTAVPPPGQPYYAPPAGAVPPGSVPPGFTPAPAGFSSFTPNVSSPQPAAAPIPPGRQALEVTPVSSPPRPSYGPPGGISPQAGLAPQYGTPTLAQAPPPAALAANQIYGSKSLAPPAAQQPGVVAPAMSWQAPGAAKSLPATPASFVGPQDSRPIRIVSPPTSPPAAISAAGNQSHANSRIPELADLPPARFSAPGATNPTPAMASAPTLASAAPTRAAGWQQPTAAAPSAAPRATMAGSPYGYDSQYRWLRGKLEYSQSTRKWRLRYIPADGATDDFGGSVILADSPALAGLQSGEMVQVQGALGGQGADQNSFAPLYNVAQIQKQ